VYAQHKLKKLNGVFCPQKLRTIIFYFSPQVVHPDRLCCVKIMEIQEIKISHLATFK